MLLRSKVPASHSVAPLSGLVVRPPSPLPAGVMRTPAGSAVVALPATVPVVHKAVAGLAIQIKPHHNGEIFLSKIAVLQNPGFFGWPFTGNTVPKKAGNIAYPQRTPDPIVNIDVYGAGQAPRLSLRNYALNTVYYSTKSEIRITASPLVSEVPNYSIMVMVPSSNVGVDYDIQIVRPDSPQYPLWVATCNQRMPGGGQTPRNFGWF